MPDVSVIMSAYKEPVDVFLEAVESIESQTYPDFEFLIVLDCPDNHELRAQINEIASNDSRVVPIWNDENIGLAESLNRAVKFSCGRFICRMDADDIAAPNRIEMQLGYVKQGNYDLVGSYLEIIDQNGEPQYGVSNIPVDDKRIKKSMRWNNCMPHPSWFGKRWVFERGYRHIPLCEDYDFLLRAALDGVRMGNCPETLVKYRMSKDSISRSNLFRQFLYQCYLSSCYSRHAVAQIDEANDWVSSHYGENEAASYAHANSLFNEGLNRIRERRLVSAIWKLIQVPFVSSRYMNKVFRLAMSAA